MAEFDERDTVRRSSRHIAEARDAIDQTRAAVATSRLVIERSRKHLKARSGSNCRSRNKRGRGWY
jgi:hypothetical protein